MRLHWIPFCVDPQFFGESSNGESSNLLGPRLAGGSVMLHVIARAIIKFIVAALCMRTT